MIDLRPTIRVLKKCLYDKAEKYGILTKYRRNIDGAIYANASSINKFSIAQIRDKIWEHICYLAVKAHYYDVERHEIKPVNYDPMFHHKPVTGWMKYEN